MCESEADRAKAMAAVTAMFDRYKLLSSRRPTEHIDFDREVMDNLKLLDAGLDGSVAFELHMGPNMSNLNDVMHGGAGALIFDMTTTSALCPLASPGFWEFLGGVTRSLNISYLKAVPIGINVRLNSKVMSIGRQMALIRGEMTSLDGMTVYCTAEHHKVNTPVKEQHAKARIPWDDQFETEWKSKEKSKVKSKI